MIVRHRMLVVLAGLWAVLACGRKDDGTIRLTGPGTLARLDSADQPPVATNASSPVEYPPVLLDQGIEGQVLLRLYADASGRLSPDSTRVAESSGYPALDSAALAGAPRLHFSPALRRGRPVAAAFLQPVQFRNPRTGGASP